MIKTILRNYLIINNIKKLNSIFNKSNKFFISDSTKIVIMSDLHRGKKDKYDNFSKNEDIFLYALDYYYKKGFIYIELGDGDDLWEVKKCTDIVKSNILIFKMLNKFYNAGRLIMLYGNHDITKSSPKYFENCFGSFYNENTLESETLLSNLPIYESLILKYNNNDIFLIHGHQVDYLNSTIWKITRFLVRSLWRTLEKNGVNDPTKSIKNYKVAKNTEKILENYSIKNNKILIAGHTHRPVFPKDNNSLYFNTGSGVHPNGITSIEIDNGYIALVKWEYKINRGELFSVRRNVLEKEKISSFYKNNVYK